LRIIIDILTPKQCMFFPKLIEGLGERGHQVFKTTRRYREVIELLKLKGIEAKAIGEHGGKELASKLKASAQRVLELVSVFEDVKPDVAVSFSSPEMARVSYGLKVPHLCINDSPHAEAVARLTVPLSERLLTPKVIPKKAWVKYGIAPEKIVQYNALDPWVWLRDFKPDARVLQDLRLDRTRPILTLRTEETYAAYLLGKTQERTSIIPLIEDVLKEGGNLQIVALPRYDEQAEALREAFNGRVAVCESVVDGPSLLHYTAVFVGGGGTMNAEAALLGVPTFSCYPDEPSMIEGYLIRKRLVTRELDHRKLVRGILVTLSKADLERSRQSARVRRLVKDFEDPVEITTREIEKLS